MRTDIADQTRRAVTVANDDGKRLTNLRLLEEMKDFYLTPGIRAMKLKLYGCHVIMYLAANAK